MLAAYIFDVISLYPGEDTEPFVLCDFKEMARTLSLMHLRGLTNA